MAIENHHCRKRPRIISSELAASNLAPATIGNLGEDVLVEILIRGLPNPRSACQGKLVCKRWSSLISSPRFNRRFVSHQSLKHPPMPDDPYELESIIRSFLPPMPDGVAVAVLDCNRDLVLCGFRGSALEEDEESSRSYLVCNPFTKQWFALPLAPRNTSRSKVHAARLVCEPRISSKLDLGDDQTFVYSEYRFRVACIYHVYTPNIAIKLDMFCSESGEWSKEFCLCDDHFIIGNAISCNEELFWTYFKPHNLDNILVGRFNPFRLDIPPIPIDASAFHGKVPWFISSSQGALHVIVLQNETVTLRLSVWRLEEDDKSWKKQCQGLVKKASNFCDCVVKCIDRRYLHPHEPGIVFFNCTGEGHKNAILCCDLRREEIEVFARLEGGSRRLQVFRPRVYCWPTPIPKYEELRGIYDGSYRFWVQGSREAKTPPLPPSLIECMDHLMKSASYKDYLEYVTAEATLKTVTQIIRRRHKALRESQLRSPELDGYWDVLKADLLHIQDDMYSVGKLKRELDRKALWGETDELCFPPPGPNLRPEPCRWGLKHIMELITHYINPLKRKREAKE